MNNNPPKKIYAKYALVPEGRDVHARFSAAYNESSKGKAQLTAQCIAGGFLLRECGLLTLTTEICESEEYLAATSASQRREIVLRELFNLSGVSREAPAMPQVAVGEVHAPSPTQEQRKEPTEPVEPQSEDEQAEDEQQSADGQGPAIRRGPVMRSQTVLPNLGATTTPANNKK